MTYDATPNWEGPPAAWAVELLIDLVSGQAIEEAELPHIVVCRTADTGYTTYSGPYRTAIDAMVAADREECTAAQDNEFALEFSVAPIYRASPIE